MPNTFKVTEYTICAVPEDACSDFWLFEVKVVYKGHGKWAVMHSGDCLSDRGVWDYEPIPSSRTERWLERHRFTEDEALRLAEEWAPKVTVNGHVAALVGSGRDITELPQDPPRAEPVVDLMAALEKSLEKIKQAPGREGLNEQA